MTSIEIAIAVGAIIGLLVGMIPSGKTGCLVLLIIPFAMLVYTAGELSDASRRPDALDALLYVFNPLWPSLGALAGFALVRIARRFVSRGEGVED